MADPARAVCVLVWAVSRPVVDGGDPSPNKLYPSVLDFGKCRDAVGKYLRDRVKTIEDARESKREFDAEKKRLSALFTEIFPGDSYEAAMDMIYRQSVGIPPDKPPPPPPSEFAQRYALETSLCAWVMAVYEGLVGEGGPRPSPWDADECLAAVAVQLHRQARARGTSYAHERERFGKMFTGLHAVPYGEAAALLTHVASQGPADAQPSEFARRRTGIEGNGRPHVTLAAGVAAGVAAGAAVAVALTAGAIVLHRRRGRPRGRSLP